MTDEWVAEDEAIANARYHRNTSNDERMQQETSQIVISAKVTKYPTWVQKEGEIRTCRCTTGFYRAIKNIHAIANTHRDDERKQGDSGGRATADGVIFRPGIHHG